ncbi:SCO6880 family protein [Streptomyces sp. SP17BM10]|uniref:SCO6880 family protein n=1 Tax=Streptomyces sp. SP17BM10 TaxID=3002530 RepID=UPI002E79146A|nr:SCO6880 family protein [Streptomyces sp. SP17BM10]
MAAVDIGRPRTYGNWRKPRSPGIGGLGMAGTMVMMAGMIFVVICMAIDFFLAIGAGVLVGLCLLPLLIKDKFGRNGLQRGTARVAWWRGKSAGKHIYRSGILGRTPYGTCQLPGLAAASSLAQFHDSHNRPFAMVSLPSLNHHTVVISCDADGASLVDTDQVDTWVAHWGHWLASLAHEPGLVAASVTVEAAPDPGSRLSAEVHGHLHPEAPPLARQVLEQIVDNYPAGSALLTTQIALTFSGAARGSAPRRDVDQVAEEVGARLPGLTAGLAMTGAGAARPMTAGDLAETVRVAYDPSVATLVAEGRAAGGTGITWDDAGPVATEEFWSHYRHDGAWSKVWFMGEAPRGEVFSNVLTSLLLPHPDVTRKRVSLLYRPHDPAAAARIVENDRKDAMFQAQQAAVAAARDSVAVRAAEQAAQEEATGAGLVRFGMIVTATVMDRNDLPKADAVVENLSTPSRIQLRPALGSQASAFAAGLPIGIVLPNHLRVPQAIREAM